MNKRDCFSNYIINNNLFIFFIYMNDITFCVDNDVLNKNIIKDIINNINKIKLGFVISKADVDKLTYGIISSHCIENKNIFNKEQISNINNIINMIGYD